MDTQKTDPPLRDALEGISVRSYEAVFEYIRMESEDKTLLYCPEAISVKLFNAIPQSTEIIESDSIIGKLKAVKNDIEIKNTHNASIKEGVVMVRFLKWLSEEANNYPTETDVQDKLSKLRQEQEHCLSDSFNTISAYGKNAAINHYSPDRENPIQIEPKGFLLVDTGGQYLDGTTDISRTIVMGDITDEMRRDFTLVLKGHLALARTKFIEGATGTNLDVIARLPIWAAGIDYKHGTGHGIGFCLSVHEGPHRISMHLNEHKLLPGMLCTNEPGIYKEGRYGIRIENVMLVKELEQTEFGTFLGFEPMSLCPIDTNAIDLSLLTQEEIDYLNSYHQMVYEKLEPFLNQDEREWLRDATKAL
jgi:Xaa-Pro aminopeptidase